MSDRLIRFPGTSWEEIEALPQLFEAFGGRLRQPTDLPDTEAFQKAMQSEEAADAMRFDGVRPETLLILEQASDHL